MPQSTRPRPKGTGYMRRNTRHNAMARALGARQTFTERDQLAMALPPRAALEAIRHGAGQIEHFGDLAMAVNIALICGERIGPQAEAAGLAARDALLAVRERFGRARKWGFTGTEAGAVVAALDLYDQLLSLLTAEQLRTAVAEYSKRVAANHHLGGRNG
jgi:hypothetical protein